DRLAGGAGIDAAQVVRAIHEQPEPVVAGGFDGPDLQVAGLPNALARRGERRGDRVVVERVARLARGDVEDPVADPVRVLVPVPEALAVEPLDPGHRMVEQGRGVVAEEGFGAGIVVFGQHRGRVGLDGRGGGRGGDQAAEGGTEEAGVGGGHRGPHGNRAGRIRPTLPGSAARRTRPAVLNPLPRSPGGAGILPGPCGWGARLSSRRPVPPSSPASVPPHAEAAAEVRPPLPAAMEPVAVRAWTATTALGTGADAQLAGLHSGRSGLRPNDFGPLVDGAPLPCWIGRVG